MTRVEPTAPSRPELAVVARELLAHARRAFDPPALSYAEPPAPLDGGQDTAVYAFGVYPPPAATGAPLVLRVFPESGDTLAVGAARARREAAAQRTLAAQGYPAPAVIDVGDVDTIADRHFLVMERLRGRMLFSQLIPPTRHALGIGTLLAETQARLHALNPAPLEQAFDAIGERDALRPDAALDWNDAELAARGAGGLRDAWRWLRTHRPADTTRAVCHGDFHPLNVLVQGAHVTGVLDWSSARIADPHYDVASTIVLNLWGPADVPRVLARPFAAMRTALNAQYRRAYARLRPLDPARLAYYEAFALADRLSEIAAARARGGFSAWGRAGLPEQLAQRFAALTGVVVRAPGADDPDDGITWL